MRLDPRSATSAPAQRERPGGDARPQPVGAPPESVQGFVPADPSRGRRTKVSRLRFVPRKSTSAMIRNGETISPEGHPPPFEQNDPAKTVIHRA